MGQPTLATSVRKMTMKKTMARMTVQPALRRACDRTMESVSLLWASARLRTVFGLSKCRVSFQSVSTQCPLGSR